jgi:tryptophanyl-tRNA synthetase
VVIEKLVETLAPIQERRKEFEKNPQKVWDIIEEGNRKARITAQKTMEEVRKAIGL